MTPDGPFGDVNCFGHSWGLVETQSKWLWQRTDTCCGLQGSPLKVSRSFPCDARCLEAMTNTETDKHPGDARVFEAARYQIREGFREKSFLSPSDPAVLPAIQHAEEVASFLRANLVQGRKDGETYSKTA